MYREREIIYIYIYMYMYMCVYIYIYIYYSARCPDSSAPAKRVLGPTGT